MVRAVAADIGIAAEIRQYENPRAEMEEHFYQPDRQRLVDLGYQPTANIKAVMKEMMLDLLENRDRIEAHADVLIPDIRWEGGRRRSQVIG